MFEQIGRLAQRVEDLPVPASPEELATLFGVLDRLTAKVTLGTGAVVASGEWAAHGDVSPAAWLRRACRLSTKQAASVSATAARLGALPLTAAAYSSGALSTSHVGCITANVTDATVKLFAEQEDEMLPTLVELAPSDLAVAMRYWAAAAEDQLGGDAPTPPRRSLHLSRTLDGRGELSGSFDAEGRETITAALRLTSTWAGDDVRKAPERLADALVELARQHLVRHDEPSRNRNRPRIELIVDVNDIDHARLVDGTTLDRVTTGRLLCDSTLHRVLTDGRGVILDYGRATRLVPRGLWDTIVVRDRTCRHDGCDRPPAWSEAHHVLPWEHGGPTSLENLVLLCSRHHHLIHQPGWHAKLLPDGTYEVTTPTGTTLTTRPPPW